MCPADHKFPGLHKLNDLPTGSHANPAGAGVMLCGVTSGATKLLVDWAVSKGLGPPGSLLVWQQPEDGKYTLAWRD
jgi:hypothetical protein